MPLRKFIAVLLVLFPGLCFGKSDGISESQKTLTRTRTSRVGASEARNRIRCHRTYFSQFV